MMWQIIEKDDIGTDWHQVRYDVYAMERFPTKDEAIEGAKKYLTSINCDNCLTKEEKKGAIEAFMLLDKDAGCFLGVLDGEDWYMEDRHGEPVNEANYFELEGKAQVAVQEAPGT